MSPFIAFHATRPACRDSIRKRGLLASRPARTQPFGVYVFADTIRNNPFGMLYRSRRTAWGSSDGQDVWQVAYVGTMMADRFVENAMVLTDTVPPEMVTLVTGNN